MKLIFGSLTGALFGLGLIVAQMTDPHRVLGFLDVFGHWDPRLGLVMFGAIAVHAPFIFWFERHGKPLFARAQHLPTETHIDRRLLLGATLFGIGWGMAGYCPGPAIVAAPANPSALLLVLSMVVGMWIEGHASRLRPLVPRWLQSALHDSSSPS
jgi:uncharacterized protein